MVPVPLLKIRTPSQNELYACQVKLAAPGQNLEPWRSNLKDFLKFKKEESLRESSSNCAG